MPRDLRRTLARVQPFLVALAFVLFALLLQRQWSALRAHEWRLRPAWLAASAACTVAGWLIEIAIWQRLIGLFRQRLPYARAVRIWFASAIVRYVPGSIWQPLSLTTRGQAAGVRPEVTLASLTLYHIIHVLAVAPIAAIYVRGWGRSLPESWLQVSPWWAAVLLVPVAGFVARPRVLVDIANRMMRALGREPLPVNLHTGDLLRLLLISTSAWTCFIVGFVTFALAIVTPQVLTAATWPHLLAAYPLAFAVGFATVIAPSGLAVREGVLYALLAPVLGGSNALIVALGMRVWEMLLDVLLSTAALAGEARRPRQETVRVSAADER